MLSALNTTNTREPHGYALNANIRHVLPWAAMPRLWGHTSANFCAIRVSILLAYNAEERDLTEIRARRLPWTKTPHTDACNVLLWTYWRIRHRFFENTCKTDPWIKQPWLITATKYLRPDWLTCYVKWACFVFFNAVEYVELPTWGIKNHIKN